MIVAELAPTGEDVATGIGVTGAALLIWLIAVTAGAVAFGLWRLHRGQADADARVEQIHGPVLASTRHAEAVQGHTPPSWMPADGQPADTSETMMWQTRARPGRAARLVEALRAAVRPLPPLPPITVHHTPVPVPVEHRGVGGGSADEWLASMRRDLDAAVPMPDVCAAAPDHAPAVEQGKPVGRSAHADRRPAHAAGVTAAWPTVDRRTHLRAGKRARTEGWDPADIAAELAANPDLTDADVQRAAEDEARQRFTDAGLPELPQRVRTVPARGSASLPHRDWADELDVQSHVLAGRMRSAANEVDTAFLVPVAPVAPPGQVSP